MFKKQIYFKYVFLVGGTKELFGSQAMHKFLSAVVKQEMKPFALYLVKGINSKEEIVMRDFGHLCF